MNHEIIVIVNNKKRRIPISDLLKIDEFNIQEDLIRHCEFLAVIGDLKNRKKHEVRVTNRELVELKSHIYDELKRSGRKMNETYLSNKINIDNRYKHIVRKLEEHERYLDMLSTLYDIMKERKDMLTQVSSNLKIDKKMSLSWEKRLKAMELKFKEHIKNDE